MRYTRNRQMQKIDTSVWRGEKNHPIESMRDKYLAHKLDESFEWKRNGNYVKFYVYSKNGVKVKVLMNK